MDAFDEGSVSTVDSTGLGRPTLVALVLAVTGIVAGIAGIYLGYSAGRDLDAFAAKLESEPDETVALLSKLEEMEEGLVKLGSETVRLSRQDRQLQENIKAALESLQETIDTNRAALNALTERVGEVANRGDVGRSTSFNPVAEASMGPPAADGSSSDGAQAIPGVHFVEGGDTLSKIAKQYGVSLNDLLRANPTVNPKAMQIGQQIVIP